MLIYPIFVTDDDDEETLIPSLPGQSRRGINKLVPFFSGISRISDLPSPDLIGYMSGRTTSSRVLKA